MPIFFSRLETRTCVRDRASSLTHFHRIWQLFHFHFHYGTSTNFYIKAFLFGTLETAEVRQQRTYIIK